MFLSYYMYSRIKFGTKKEYSHERVSSLASYNALLKLYALYAQRNKRVPKTELHKDLEKLKQQAEQRLMLDYFINAANCISKNKT